MYSQEYEWATMMSCYQCNTLYIGQYADEKRTTMKSEDDIEFEQGIKQSFYDNMLSFLPTKFTKHRP